MSDQQHPFERLPVEIRQTPEVVDAWLSDLSHRSKNASHRPPEVQTPFGKLPLPVVLLVLLWLMIAHPDKVLKVIGL